MSRKSEYNNPYIPEMLSKKRLQIWGRHMLDLYLELTYMSLTQMAHKNSSFITRPRVADGETSPMYWATKIRELSGVLTELDTLKQSHLENVASAYDEEKDVIEQVIKTLTPLSQSKTISKIAQIHTEGMHDSESEIDVIDLTGGDDVSQVKHTLQF